MRERGKAIDVRLCANILYMRIPMYTCGTIQCGRYFQYRPAERQPVRIETLREMASAVFGDPLLIASYFTYLLLPHIFPLLTTFSFVQLLWIPQSHWLQAFRSSWDAGEVFTLISIYFPNFSSLIIFPKNWNAIDSLTAGSWNSCKEFT